MPYPRNNSELLFISCPQRIHQRERRLCLGILQMIGRVAHMEEHLVTRAMRDKQGVFECAYFDYLSIKLPEKAENIESLFGEVRDRLCNKLMYVLADRNRIT